MSTQPAVPSSPPPTVPPATFYEFADHGRLEGPAGSLIDVLELEAPVGIRGWVVLYRSIGFAGQAVGVSGLVLAPDSAVGPRPILACAHGTTGLADPCAPSHAGVAGIGLPDLIGLARLGYVVTATDYEGLGTPGIHPYLIGSSEGHSVLDSIRAASVIPETGAGPGSRAAVIGISQGAHAALWTAELAPTYAPELDLVGVVAASPPIDLHAVQHAVLGGPPVSDVGWLEALMVVRAWTEAYGAPVNELLTAEGQSISETLGSVCPWEVAPPLTNPFLRLDIPEWLVLLEANSPGHAASRAPILAVAARSDEQVPAGTIASGIDRLRRAGSTVELRWVEGSHVATLADPASAEASIAWINDRFAARDGR